MNPVANKVFRGGPVPNRVFDEIGKVAVEAPTPSQKGAIDYRATDAGDAYRFRGDVDRVGGGLVKLNTREPLFGGRRYNLDYEGPDGQTRSLPTRLAEVYDVTLNSRQGEAMALLQEDGSWQLQRFDLHQHVGRFSKAEGEVVAYLDNAPTIMEYSAEGKLLLGQGQEIQTLEQGQMVPFLSFPGKVQNLNTLSDGGLCVQVENQICTHSDYYYVPPQSNEPIHLSQADAGLMEEKRFSRPFEFIKRMSPREREQLTEGVTKGNAWWDGRNAESTSPDGQTSIGISYHRLYARVGTSDLGEIQVVENVSAPEAKMFKDYGIDLESAVWSGGGRLFGVFSRPDEQALPETRDAFLWSPLTRQGTFVPGVQKLQGQPDGTMLLELIGQPPRVVAPEQLADLKQQAWYQEALARPITTQTRNTVYSAVRGGERRTLVEEVDQFDTLTASADGRYIIGIEDGARAGKLWDTEFGISVALPPAQHCYWDDQRDQLGVVHPDGHYEAYPSSNLRSAPWFRQALQQFVGGTPAPVVAPPVQAGNGGVAIGGLAMPKKPRKS